MNPEGEARSAWGEPARPDGMPADPPPAIRSTTNGSGRVELAPWSWSVAPVANQVRSDHRVLRGIRSALALATIALALAVAAAAAASLLIWAIAAAIHHAAAN